MSRHLSPALSILLLLLTAPASDAADYWPGWLGPKRDGWVSDFQPPAQWPQTLNKGWQIEVGSGYGSPLVDGDRVYQHGRIGDDEVVSCIDRNTGELIWRKSDRVPFKMGGGGDKHGKGPKSCPTLADGRIFTLSITGILIARDADSGEELWRRDNGPKFKKARDGNSHPYWGACTSPIVADDRVILRFGTDEEGELVALNVTNGNVEWRSADTSGAAYASPLLVEIHGVQQIVEWNHLNLTGVDSKTGVQLWSFPFPHVGTDQNMPTPVFHSGRILLGGENRGILGLDIQRTGSKWNVQQLWHQKDVALDMSTAVINDGRLFGFSHYGKGRLFCLNPDSGKLIWLSPGRHGANATFLSMPGHVAALLDRGELRILETTSDKYNEAATWQVATTPTWAPPVLLQDGVLTKDVNTLTFWSFAAE